MTFSVTVILLLEVNRHLYEDLVFAFDLVRLCSSSILFWFEKAYHFKWIILYEHSFCERVVRRVGHVDALPRQRLQNVPVVEAVVIGIRVHVGQREAVQLRVGQTTYDRRLQVFLILEQNIKKKITIFKSVEQYIICLQDIYLSDFLEIILTI